MAGVGLTKRWRAVRFRNSKLSCPFKTPILTEERLQALRQELAYASYLNLQTVILPPPRNRGHVADYARVVNACLSITYPGLQISVRIPVYDPRTLSPSSVAPHLEDAPAPPLLRVPEGDLSSTWEMWDVIRTICGHNPRLSLSMRHPPCNRGSNH
jgi:type II protein arginine methyltransferase